MTRRPLRGLLTPALLALGLVTTLAVAGSPAPTAEAAPAAAPATTASGAAVTDIDGGTLAGPSPVAQWSDGDTVTTTHPGLTDVLLLNTTRTGASTARAASDGATASVADGTVQLRQRPAVAFTGLEVVCGVDGTSSVTLDSLTVDGQDVLRPDALATGYTYDLPDSIYGPTQLRVGDRRTDAHGRTQTTGLWIEAEGGASEIWRVTLGRVACEERPATVESVVSGVTVTAPDGTRLLDQEPRIVSGTGTGSAETLAAADYPASARDVTVAREADGAARVRVGEFRQVPAVGDPVGEFRPSALRVYGLELVVEADGSSRVVFDNAGSAVFANGVWINTATDRFTAVDPVTGQERLRIHLNERIENADGTTTIHGLRYEDLTGTHPEVVLGRILYTPADAEPEPGPSPGPEPDPGPGTGPELPSHHAFGVWATGASVVDPAPVAGGDRGEKAHLERVVDGLTGQVTVEDVTVESGQDGARVAVGDVLLYPGTDVEIALRDLVVVVDDDGAEVTSAGGTVAGTPVAAGAIEPNTIIPVPGRSLTITMNRQDSDEDVRRVTGLDVDDPRGLATHVRVAGVQDAAPPAAEVPPVTPPVTDEPGGPGDGELGNGAIPVGSDEPATPGGPGAPNGPGSAGGGTGQGAGSGGAGDVGAPAGDAGDRGGLARTGVSGVALAALAAALLVGAGVVARRVATALR